MRLSSRSFSTPAIVLKRTNVGETDRVMTLLTKSHGKIVCVAKGVRKMKSTKRSAMEPGCLISAFLINTKSLPLLTQAKLIDDYRGCKTTLPRIRRLMQVLEIVDKLFVEGETEIELFDKIVNILKQLNTSPSNSGSIRTDLDMVITTLGFQSLKDSAHSSHLDHVSEISERPMRSFKYLSLE